VSFVHVEDVAQAFLGAASNAQGGLHVYNVADDRPTTWREFLGLMSARLGTRPATFLPPIVGRLYAVGSCLWSTVMRRAPVVTGHVVRLITTPKALTNHRLKRDLKVELRYPDCRMGLDDALGSQPRRGEAA
jgi:nucleoside-diphosphate-sugar epimerase